VLANDPFESPFGNDFQSDPFKNSIVEAKGDTQAPPPHPHVTTAAISMISRMELLQASVPHGTTAYPMSVPKELWRLIQVLKSAEALESPSLFEYYMGFGGVGAYSDPQELAVIREALSTGRKFPPGIVTPKGLVFAMGQFLYALPRPVIPYWSWPDSSLAAKTDGNGDEGEDLGKQLHTQLMRSYCQKLLQQLPLLHYNTFVFIISFLRLVLSHSASNHTSPQRLAVFCDGCLSGHADDHVKRQALREVFEYFIITNDL
jgi:hypothetical protein